jgi:glucokinase
MKFIFGIDIGGTSIKIGQFNLVGELLYKFSIPTNTEDSGKHILPDIARAIHELDILESDILGYGFGVPGPVSNNQVIKCVNLNWTEKDIVSEFGELVNNYYIKVGNDANVAALGEITHGSARGHHHAVMITLGTGVGGGIISKGHMIDGVYGAGGEIGHIKVDFDYNFECKCGTKGCLETVASATGIKRIYAHKHNAKYSLNQSYTDISAKQVFEDAMNQDELALEVIDEISEYLGYACHILSLTINPSIFIFGGGVSKAGDFLIERISKAFKKYRFINPDQYEFTVASLGNEAGIFGGYALIKREN